MFTDPYDTAGNIAAGFMPPWLGNETNTENEPKKCGCCMQLTPETDGEFLTKAKNDLPPLKFYCYECIDSEE